MKKMSDILVELQTKSEEDVKRVKNAQDHFHAVSAGLSSNDDGEDQTLADQLLGMSFKFSIDFKIRTTHSDIQRK
jgi:structural maintenance of chromosome 2